MLYRFESFELDASQYRLSREQTPIHLKPKVLALLVYLLEHRARVVTKEELLATLWEGRFVGDGVLAEAVHELRRALGEEAGAGAFIRTVHRRGYQFVFDPVDTLAPHDQPRAGGRAHFCLVWNGILTPLEYGENFIGRDTSCLVTLAGLLVSRKHARIDVTPSAAVVHDLGSKNGTVVNGERISAPTSLSDGDVIEIGDFAITVRERLGDASTLSSIGRAGS